MKRIFVVGIILVLVIIISVFSSETPSPDVLWERTYDSGDYDEGFKVVLDSLNNIIVVGRSGWNESYKGNCVIIKYDPEGNEIWKISENKIIEYASVTIDSKNNILVLGMRDNPTKNFGHTYYQDAYIIKYDSEGKKIGELITPVGVVPKSIIFDKSDNFILSGYNATSKFYLVKYDQNGKVIWERKYYEGKIIMPEDIVIDSQNNIIVTGDCVGETNYHYYTIKCDSEGNIIWAKEYNSGGGDFARGVALDSKDNIIVTGQVQLGNDYGDIYTIKYDPMGNVLWSKRYDKRTDGGRDVAIDSNDNIIIAGFSKVEFFTMKYSPNGEIIWKKSEVGSSADGVAIDSFNNVIAVGNSNGNYLTIKYKGN